LFVKTTRVTNGYWKRTVQY